MTEDAHAMPAERSAGVGENASNERAKVARSRVTNHQDLLPGLDGRSSAARRFRDLILAFVQDQGGPDQCSEIKLGLLRRLAATTVQAELLEARMVNGELVDIPTLCQLASTVVRLSSKLGLERVARDIGVSFGAMLKADIDKNRRRRERRNRLGATAA